MRFLCVAAWSAVLAGRSVLGAADTVPTSPAAGRAAAILTPPPPAAPRINGPRVYGERPGRPFLYHIPATGRRPMHFSVQGLPQGLAIDPKRGMISGGVAQAGTWPVKITAFNDRGADSIVLKIVIGDTICLTPPMGWNSWNAFHRNIDEAKIRQAADAMAERLIDHGWTYINIDDCWQGRRDDKGRIQGNEKFPDLRHLADYVHAKGLKFGIYSSPGPRTCAGFEGSYGHEDQDAQSYAEWGVDYVKYDWCAYARIAAIEKATLAAELLPGSAEQLKHIVQERQKLASIPAHERAPDWRAHLRELDAQAQELLARLPPDKQRELELQVLQRPYRLFHDSLMKVDRDIVYSLCQYGMGNVWEWGPQVGANCWRTTGDIRASWDSIARIGFGQAPLMRWAGPSHWNDPDMLEVGNGRLTPDENYAHFSLWCLLSAPLLIGCDLTRMDDFVVNVLTNDDVIAVNQDELGRQAGRIGTYGETEVWSKPLADGSLAVGLFNRGQGPARCAASWEDLGIAGKRVVRDLWRQKDLGTFDGTFADTVPPHGVLLIRLIPAK